jgi:uncharacterized BrkB/YihY/UPF0761 family membrane protein
MGLIGFYLLVALATGLCVFIDILVPAMESLILLEPDSDVVKYRFWFYLGVTSLAIAAAPFAFLIYIVPKFNEAAKSGLVTGMSVAN